MPAASPGDDGLMARAEPHGRLAAAIDGDEVAFAALYRELQPPLLRYLQVVVAGAAEDVASETWLELARDIRAFRGDEAGFRGWVFTVGRHRALDWQRRERRRPAEPMAEVPDTPTVDLTADSALDAMASDDAVALIAQLPRDQAEAVMLRVIAGLDVATVARLLRKRPGAVRVNTLRGLRRLAELLPADALSEV